ncbi:MAG: hypothetical protein AUI33_14965 [Ignavibacteria bacterium 13_1_40CM_2_61_4]|nr:MAG: hypothetical protein AUI33_14965 [Ignavibacteria bacterium 13_1_40CM_2_61_4]
MSDETTLNLFQQQESNRRRTVWLMIGFVLFFLWLGLGGDLILHLYTVDAPPESYHHGFPWIGLLLGTIAVGTAWYAYKTGPEKVLWSTGAWELITPQDDKQRQLVNVVEEMAIAAGIPRPRIYIVADPDPNAFATGAARRDRPRTGPREELRRAPDDHARGHGGRGAPDSFWDLPDVPRRRPDRWRRRRRRRRGRRR